MRVELTNDLGLPDAIVKAILNDSYVGGGDISVTSLIAPAYQRKLKIEADWTEDAADRIWALVGQIGHSILERTPIEDNSVEVREQRLYMPVLDWNVSGQFDQIVDGILKDFKFTSVWSAVKGKPEWEQQLNLLAELADYHADKTGDERYRIKAVEIIAVFRDWSKNKAKAADYPKHQVAVIKLNLWDRVRRRAYMEERVRAHQASNPQPCTDEERWKQEDVFAVMKKGRIRAVKLFDERKDAQAMIDANHGESLYLEHRPGTFIRCEQYCPVSSVCPIWKAEVPF